MQTSARQRLPRRIKKEEMKRRIIPSNRAHSRAADPTARAEFASGDGKRPIRRGIWGFAKLAVHPLVS